MLWLDFLGFADLLRGLEAGDYAAIKRMQALEGLLEPNHLARYFPWRFDLQLFGDTAVLVFPFSGRNRQRVARDLYFCAGRFQCHLIGSNFLVRGAVGAGVWFTGRAFASGSLYGPLYRYESRVAVVPRILCALIDSETVDLWIEHTEEVGGDSVWAEEVVGTATDCDGELFVDYLFSGVQEDAFLRAHKSLIDEAAGTYQRQPRILSKYYWMARYHNRVIGSPGFCEMRPDLAPEAREALLVDVAMFGQRPRSPLRRTRASFYFNWERGRIDHEPNKCAWCSVPSRKRLTASRS